MCTDSWSVSRWVRAYGQLGLRGLRKARHVGRRPRLSAAQLQGLERTLKQRRPAGYVFAPGRWTKAKVRDLIERRTGGIVRELKGKRRTVRYEDSFRKLKAMMAAARTARRARRVRRPHIWRPDWLTSIFRASKPSL